MKKVMKFGIAAGAVSMIGSAVLAVKHMRESAYRNGYKAGTDDTVRFAETVLTDFYENMKHMTKPVFDKHNELVDKYNDLVENYEELCEEYENLLNSKD